MPPRFNILSAARPIAFRPRPAAPWAAVRQQIIYRGFADSKRDLPTSSNREGPNMDTLPHVSEEADAMSKIRGEEGVQVEQQGTPVEEVVKDDKEALKHLPKVMRDSMKAGASAPGGKRSFSTSTRLRAETEMIEASETSVVAEGVKFGMPALPIPKDGHHRYRYDPIVDQFTNMLMQDGEKAVAQKNMAYILNVLRTSSAPSINPNRPLLPGAPPPSHLPLNPVLYLTLAVDSIAPLLRIRSQRGAAGGGVALQIPVPLARRTRRKQAIQWIIDAAAKRKSRSSGKYTFAQRVADEVIAVVEGRSALWERRNALHKLGVSARANLNYTERSRRR